MSDKPQASFPLSIRIPAATFAQMKALSIKQRRPLANIALAYMLDGMEACDTLAAMAAATVPQQPAPVTNPKPAPSVAATVKPSAFHTAVSAPKQQMTDEELDNLNFDD